ncbi:uncharacterized protein F4822DRAFT_409311 [Hypoxylon trugodes]|uniref:uncharacterized protein n=1 Tax=Hypoxylon trugodes TaxID=326681 RepID=UPI00219132EF|nr:uncharacterized protein F4822DRAFT_409311 [Hypoxylon trugodes]KAI1386215.1 hypothetical protein F4822DRAFT_409311 [Hypoxylon trugodes]
MTVTPSCRPIIGWLCCTVHLIKALEYKIACYHLLPFIYVYFGYYLNLIIFCGVGQVKKYLSNGSSPFSGLRFAYHT